jgi:hypothetical protein
VCRLYKATYPNILAIIDLIRSLPSSSAENERGFSQLKLTKTNGRGRMSNSTLNDVMTIMMETPTVSEFDPQPAINNWLSASARKRRPGFLDGEPAEKRARLEKKEEEEEEEDLGQDDEDDVDEGESDNEMSENQVEEFMRDFV